MRAGVGTMVTPAAYCPLDATAPTRNRSTGSASSRPTGRPDETGDLVVSVPALPGCFTRGKSLDECRQRAAEAIEVHIAGLRADGEPVPEEVGTPQLLTVTVAA